MIRGGVSVGALAVLVAVFGPGAAAGPNRIYWAQSYDDQIRRADLNGTHVEVLLQWPQVNAAVVLAVDPVHGEIYWAQSFEDRILRAGLDGGGGEILLQGSPVTDPVALAVDPAGKLYWAQSYGYQIWRADLDGRNAETLLEYPDIESPPVALALDRIGNKIVWAQTAGVGALDDKIMRADLSGDNPEVIVSYPDVVALRALAVDGAGGFVYWAQTSGAGVYDDKILRTAMTGGAPVETLLVYPQLLDPVALTVDPAGGHLYWAQSQGAGSFEDQILRAALTGGDTVETLLQWPLLEGPVSIDLGPSCTADADCDDDSGCTDDTCADGTCVYANNTAPCADGLFCTAADVCTDGSCVGGGDPCPDQLCDESRDECVDCLTGDDCPPGLFCVDGVCSACPAPVVAAEGPRYFAVTPAVGVPAVGIHVRGVETDVNCVDGYVFSDGRVFEDGTKSFRPPGPTGWGTVHVRGQRLMSNRTYEFRADCDPLNPDMNLSGPVSAKLWRYGDTDNDGNASILDVVHILDGFRGLWYTIDCQTHADCQAVRPHRYCDPPRHKCLWSVLENVDIIGAGYAQCTPERVVSIIDATVSLDAFRGFPDPCRVTGCR